eukprot:CAMPEP_0185849130 /NCGR_PEP_ID=MMETSP1354-20130828/3745_1 /TAXON_ID=708628 /ORGANISM="Erythrolobus madagascarensis, Strain CCMP3276" /LENGTH=260 /DNA_ID=CAMNT_0028549611 /DNA_START=87 /DNA_END=869 /DNA_ORIENTATION=-
MDSMKLTDGGAVGASSGSAGGALDDFEFGTNVATSVHTVRLGFLRKVYGILTAQLIITMLVSALLMLVPPLQKLVLAAPWISLLATVGVFGFLIALFAFKDSHPLNLQLLLGFTMCESICVGTVCAAYAHAGLGYIVLEALFVTAFIFGSLTLYCFVSKKDFSFLGGFLYAALVSLLLAGLLQLLFGAFLGATIPPLAGFAMSAFGALVFCGYILFDTSMIMNKFSADQYIEASIALYLDLINLFLYVLQMLAYLQDRNN